VVTGASGEGSSLAAVMAGGSGLQCCLCACEERQGRVFIGQQCSKAVSPSLRLPQWRWNGRGCGGRRVAAGGQWREAVRTPTSVGKPRGTDLGRERASPALGA
jgi:hypothetical protein